MLQIFPQAHSHSVEITEIYILTFFEKFRESNVYERVDLTKIMLW